MLRSPYSPAALLLVLLMAVGSVVMWIGVPLGLIYLAAQLADSSRPSVGPYLLVLIGLPVGMAIVGKCLGTLDRLHSSLTGRQQERHRATWLRSCAPSAPRRRRGGILDKVMIVSVALAVVAFARLVLRLRRARRLPTASRKASEPPRRIPGVHVIVLGIDPGVANTGYGIVAHDRGRLVALDGGVIETAAGDDAGRAPGAHPRAGRRAAGRIPARCGRGRGPLLRLQRPQRVRRRPGPRRRHPRRRPARDPLRVLHASAGQDRGLRLRPRRTRSRSSGWSRRCLTLPDAAHARPRRGRARGRHLPRQRRADAGRAGQGGRMIALVSGEVAVRRGDHVVDRLRRRRLPARASRPRRCATCRASGRRPRSSAHLIVRDDALLLYGFATEEERDLFLLLIGVQGVGPKMALAVLSGGPPRELLAAVAAGDHARLQAVPGHRQAHRGADRRRAPRRPRSTTRSSSPERPRTTTRARWRATACSGSASTRPRSSRCSTAPPATRLRP